MTRRKLFYFDPKYVRERNYEAVLAANRMLEAERDLVRILYYLDEIRLYIRWGAKSLRGFCLQRLALTEAHTLRIIRMVRRYEPNTQDRGTINTKYLRN